MNTLSEILSSRTRAEIFRLLFGTVEEDLHVREIQRRSGLNDSTIRQELRKLVRLNLVIGQQNEGPTQITWMPAGPKEILWNMITPGVLQKTMQRSSLTL